MNRTQTPNPLRSKLLALMVLRVVLALAFLGVVVWFQLKSNFFTTLSFYPIHAIVAAVGLLTIFYAAILKRVKNLELFIYTQVAVDIALITATVYVTGGVVSYLPVLYFISVLGSSVLLNRSACYYAASVSSIAYGALMYLDFNRLLPQRYKVFSSPVTPGWEDVVTTISVNVLGLFTVAYLVGYLAEKAAKMERQLKEKGIDLDRLENLNRLIVDNIPTGIMTLDETGRITSFNRAASNITGYSLRDVYYKGVEAVSAGFIDVIEGIKVGGSVRGELEVKKKDGAGVSLGFTISPGRGGEITHIVIFQDLTLLKDMEEQLRRDDRLKALGELSASIAHEIRNPLASLSGSIQVLSRELKLRGDKRHLMEIVLRESERLNSLITDFLLFAKPATKEKEMFDVTEVIRETLGVFKNSPRVAAISIEDHLEDHLLIEGDRRQISQVFWNLFLNAANAMPGGGRLTTSSKTKDSPDGIEIRGGHRGGGLFAEVMVTDSGEGINPGNLSKVFDPFFSTREGGTGMGLSIVYRIIVSHGGTIYVSSIPGHGTTFKILLPLARMGEAT
ncbi:MAG: PAS domain S-box protein [Deltaproteobacteria bacterium]|nr:PAS domain S-box protein [Deltaproteobacteria bacterium]